MFTIKKYVVADSLEEAYKLNQSKKANILGGLLWMKMGHKTIQTAIDLSNLGLDKIEENDEYSKIIEKVVKECFEEEDLLKTHLYLSVILTTPNQIQEMNNTYRKINKATDVLSFPMFEKDEIPNIISEIEEPLGDIVISIEKVKEQAEEYGHSFERELAYMVVHGFYHLMGYDHIELLDRTEMRAKEENILKKLNITRGDE